MTSVSGIISFLAAFHPRCGANSTLRLLGRFVIRKIITHLELQHQTIPSSVCGYPAHIKGEAAYFIHNGIAGLEFARVFASWSIRVKAWCWIEPIRMDMFSQELSADDIMQVIPMIREDQSHPYYYRRKQQDQPEDLIESRLLVVPGTTMRATFIKQDSHSTQAQESILLYPSDCAYISVKLVGRSPPSPSSCQLNVTILHYTSKFELNVSRELCMTVTPNGDGDSARAILIFDPITQQLVRQLDILPKFISEPYSSYIRWKRL